MKDRGFCNSDGDFLLVPQDGLLLIKTEFGNIALEPTEIAVIPRGVKFQVELDSKEARGYVLEVYGNHLELPGLLTANPDQVAKAIFKGMRSKRNVIYVRWFWRYIMLIIKLIPEGVFKKLSL